MKQQCLTRTIILLVLFIIAQITKPFAQVTIGSSEVPVSGALLDLKEEPSGISNRGLALPRVKLKSLTITNGSNLATTIDQAPMIPSWDKDDHVGLVVYNIEKIETQAKRICPGIHIWDGEIWQPVIPYPVVDETEVVVSYSCHRKGEGTQYTIKIPSYQNMVVGNQFKLNVEVTPVINDLTVNYVSSNTEVAQIDPSGLVSAVKEGSATITASVIIDGLTYTANSEMIVHTDSPNKYIYRVAVKDKGYNGNMPDKSTILNEKALARRTKQKIAVDDTDYPISETYLNAIKQAGGEIVLQSKWLNTVCILVDHKFVIDEISKLDFVSNTTMVWIGDKSVKQVPRTVKNFPDKQLVKPNNPINYGSGKTNIDVNNGSVLHNANYRGSGIDIAVIDAGFNNIEKLAVDYNINVKSAVSFIFDDSSLEYPGIYGEHGVYVLSCLGANKEGSFVGTAPQANYWLFRTEVPNAKFPIEEDYMVAAAEYADSLGIDVINTSLGYETFQIPFDNMNYTYEMMDGKSAFASRGMQAASDKGILVVCSAGNEAKWVATPADTKDVLTVGGVDDRGNIYDRSSSGNKWVIKPDVTAFAVGVSVLKSDGLVKRENGTSFAAPIMCGLAACLWEAYPDLTNKQLMEKIRNSAEGYNPDKSRFGYGTPDMTNALK